MRIVFEGVVDRSIVLCVLIVGRVRVLWNNLCGIICVEFIDFLGLGVEFGWRELEV